MQKLIVFFSLFLLLGSSVLKAQSADDVLGLWLTDDGKAKIEIYKEAGKYNGKIVWLKEPNNDNGQPKLDKENSEEELRKRPIVGLNLVKGFTFDDGVWEDGEIYDPENGKTYACRMKLKGDKLDVRGYIGMAMFGRTVVWTRVEE
ncbi:DUF2147 domain-containing protein [Roseivirga sp.]|uniref:DUF2147 domain-containing protein n=1 Tax=Roseivirga sp. TaxID=1964215 RepID=UPI003B525ED3